MKRLCSKAVAYMAVLALCLSALLCFQVGVAAADTLVAQWVATGSYSDIGSAVFYTRSGCAGTTTTASGSSSQTWGSFQDAYDSLGDNQYMVISIDNLPNTDNATIPTGFELRGYKRNSTDSDSTSTYFKPANNTDIVTVTKASSSNITLTIDGPIYHNANKKKEVKYEFLKGKSFYEK